ncbi:hypothetical protein FB45DRAFT_1116331 [Roridomyces roridus]|uniref:Uncharacterized protein n=1 Tax=Roridomyces roridus TaxID=1738132 RepID=A0AAD7CBZ1_9AGAR|nr:hypothetical protein FB45DRAFT_1116331 [Roridomyces roridus]
MAAFCAKLHRFTAVKELRAYRLRFSREALINLCRLPLLTDLTIEGCTGLDGMLDLETLRLRVSKFVFSGEDSLWLSLLHPEHLRELVVSAISDVVGKTLAAGPTFPRTQTLTLIPIDLSKMSQNLVILAKFPGLRSLQFYGLGQVNDDAILASVQDVLPMLKGYVGTPELLPYLLSKSTLARLLITLCTSADLASQLRVGSSHITSLHASLFELDHGALDSISTSLPRLLDLRIDIFSSSRNPDGINTLAMDFFSALVAEIRVLPTGLQRLAISRCFDYEFQGSESRSGTSPPPHFLVMWDKLREICPALTMLWLDGQDFIFWRRRSAERDFNEEVDYVPGEIETTTAEEVATAFADEIRGKNVLITGTSIGGIGFETARVIAKHANLVIMTGHSEERLTAAVLIHNAAAPAGPLSLTVDHFELQMAIAHFVPFLFTKLIAPKILAANTTEYTPRIVFVSSIGHSLGTGVHFPTLGPWFPGSEMEKEGKARFNPMEVYFQAKSAMVLTALEIWRRSEGKVNAYSLHPGAIDTNILYYPQSIEPMKALGMLDSEGRPNKSITWKTMGQGAATTVVAAFDPSLNDKPGTYLDDCAPANDIVGKESKDMDNATRLWTMSEEIVGEKFVF